MYFLWAETKLGIKEGPTTLVDFIKWLGSKRCRHLFSFSLSVRCFGRILGAAHFWTGSLLTVLRAIFAFLVCCGVFWGPDLFPCTFYESPL